MIFRFFFILPDVHVFIYDFDFLYLASTCFYMIVNVGFTWFWMWVSYDFECRQYYDYECEHLYDYECGHVYIAAREGGNRTLRGPRPPSWKLMYCQLIQVSPLGAVSKASKTKTNECGHLYDYECGHWYDYECGHLSDYKCGHLYQDECAAAFLNFFGCFWFCSLFMIFRFF